ncbi:composite domain of metallo-dependent hydrolase [Sarocladium strictum]
MTSFIIRGVRLFDGLDVSENTSVLIKDGVIAEVGPNTEAEGVPIIEKPGHTLLPGLIDAHVHPDDNAAFSEQAFRFGVTTLMEMQNRHAAQQKQWSRERKDFPDIKSTHSAATIENGWPAAILKKVSGPEGSDFDKWPNVKTVEDAEPYIEKALAEGSDYIKLFHERGKAIGLPAGSLNQPSEAVQAAVVQAAHKNNLKVVAHALSLVDTVEILRAGVDGLAHTFFDEPITEEVKNLYKKTGAWVSPTLYVIGTLTGETYDAAELYASDPRVASRISEAEVDTLRSKLVMKEESAKLENAVESVRQLKAQGVDILAGSDSGPGLATIFGVALHLELYHLVHAAGLSPLEALRAVTSTTARCFGWSDRGMVEPGKKADLLLVEGNPLEDIRELLNIRGVWRDGVEFKGHTGFPREI